MHNKNLIESASFFASHVSLKRDTFQPVRMILAILPENTNKILIYIQMRGGV